MRLSLALAAAAVTVALAAQEEVCELLTLTVTGDFVWVPMPDAFAYSGHHSASKPTSQFDGSSPPVESFATQASPISDRSHHWADWSSFPGGHGSGKPTTRVAVSSTSTSVVPPDSSATSKSAWVDWQSSVSATTAKSHSTPSLSATKSTTSSRSTTTNRSSRSNWSTSRHSTTSSAAESTSHLHSTTTRQSSSTAPTTFTTLRGTVCTITTTITSTTTSTVFTTVTPDPSSTTTTIIETSTSTTIASQETSVFSSTSTVFETSTETTTETDTATETASTTITTTSTSTVPTPAGFTPIQSVYPQDPAAKKRQVATTTSAAQAGTGVPEVIQASCTSTFSSTTTETSTVSSTTTSTLPAETTTSTETSTLTSVSTVLPDPASTTLTFFSTSTLTSTTTETTNTVTTSTTTITSSAPTQTFYAACANNNQLSRYRGRINSVQFSSAGGGRLFASASSYDCCVSCFQDSRCAASFWTIENDCTFAYNNVCDGSDSAGTFASFNTDGVYFVMINGPCGQWRYSG